MQIFSNDSRGLLNSSLAIRSSSSSRGRPWPSSSKWRFSLEDIKWEKVGSVICSGTLQLVFCNGCFLLQLKRKIVASAIKKKGGNYILQSLVKNVNNFYINYPLLPSPEKRLPITATVGGTPWSWKLLGNSSSHIRKDWATISLYLIKCSLAPCSGYLEKEKQRGFKQQISST